ncbi:GlxA family transcriptional regulator [Nitrosomonas ureae]|uniref:Transcriptional regulator GlxA family, contains an amidase domain and an AraC-type DNA-binding HTH domain n=1 Tax=Nitrosomonas ureae TaxID=44577 RepID=A0A1H2DLS3_9PROT|nr:helix-turn-helix domain-containing protein [Nitrosomonas ureae]ALQ50594.1 AraC family transcriptional regulator [Nitrosomonas ureae]SDT83862.1 Transcriptional regulator GlxA family, contains an amidase domain and an AraC-type DNA-binding HTH domain [Nitrosomonas ureae]
MSVPLVAVIAFNHFSPFHLSVPCIIFGDLLHDQKLFELRIYADEPGKLRSNEGLSVESSLSVDELAQADIIIVPSWRDPAEKPDQSMLDALVTAHARGSQVVGLCLGTYVLAYAGLLKNHKAATHWEFEQDFISRFPDVKLDCNALYVDDDRLITSAGTAAGLDCCLYLVRQHYGSVIANKLARRMVIPPYREGGQAQFIERPVPVSTQDARINMLLDYLRNNLNKVHGLDELSHYIMMSHRTFTRQFYKATGMSVGEWLLVERLQRSQELLESTSLPIDAVAEQVGFQSATSLRQHFKHRFDVTPSEWRKTFQGKRPTAVNHLATNF